MPGVAREEPAVSAYVITRLIFTDFRNYTQLKVDVDNRPVVLTGANGSGKTNLLEAISFLTPGRGLRRAKLLDAARAKGGGGWAVAADVHSDAGAHKLGTGLVIEGAGGEVIERRQVRIDGQDRKSTRLNSSHVKISYAVF